MAGPLPRCARRRWFACLVPLLLGLAAQEPPLQNSPMKQEIPQVTATYGQHDPKRRVFFTILFEEQGSVGDCAWKDRVEARYALLPTWDGARGIDPGLNLPEQVRSRLGLQSVGSSEERFDQRGGFLGLKKGEILQFYIKESDQAGSGNLSDQRHSWSETLRDGTRRMVEDGDASTSHEPNAWDADATLTRTGSGARLTFSWQCGTGQEMGASAAHPYSTWSPSPKEFLAFDLTDQDLRDWERIHKVRAGRFSLDGGGGSIRAALSPGRLPEDEIEVQVEPESGYDQWAPRGNLETPTKPGNSLTIYCYVRKKGDSDKVRQAKLDFTWKKVSAEPGVCLNWPGMGASGDNDLQFLKEENDDPKLKVESAESAHSDGLVEKVRLVVSCLDFGAYGTLHIAATDQDGKDVKVKVRGEDKADLDIPFDENHNHIADAWEKQWAGGLQGQETDDEDDQPAGDGHTGDVLSLFEEYRGFRISGGPELTATGGQPHEQIDGLHVRTNPKVKDVFICDTLGLGIGSFRDSGLQVHLVKPEECGTSRGNSFNRHTINPNAGVYSKADQYALWIVGGDVNGVYVGEAIMKSGPSVPRDCERVQVRPPVADPSKAISPEETRVTLTHELAHACNVKHHGDRNFLDIVKAEYLEDQTDGKGNVLNPKGKVVENPDGGWSLAFESGSPASGDTHCYMGYTANFVRDPQGLLRVWAANGVSIRARQLNPGLDRYAKFRFCGPPSTWELGPAGPPDKEGGDCQHQFCVNHLKHNLPNP